MTWPDLATLTPLLGHLSSLGEIYLNEIDRRSQVWLSILSEPGWIVPLADYGYSPTERFLDIATELSTIDRQRYICFAVPAYRRYLIAVLTEGLIKAGQVNYYQHLEEWITQDLASLAGDINSLIDEIENGQSHIVEWSTESINSKFIEWHSSHQSFADWDRGLLGLSGTPDQIFVAVLKYTKLFSEPTKHRGLSHGPIALLPDFQLEHDTSGLLQLPICAPWCVARRTVHSSLPFYDSDGHTLYDVDQPTNEIWQDVLAQQPYYRATLRAAIAVRFSDYDSEKITLRVSDDLDSTQLVIGVSERGSLVELLPQLVETLAYRAFVRPSREQGKRILENWITVGALEMLNGEVRLTEAYARTLAERRRAQVLLRGTGQVEQEHIKRVLKGIV